MCGYRSKEEWVGEARSLSTRPVHLKNCRVSLHLSAFSLTRLTSLSSRHWDAAHTVLSIVLSEPATAVRRAALASKWLLVPDGFRFVRTSLLSCLSYWTCRDTVTVHRAQMKEVSISAQTPGPLGPECCALAQQERLHSRQKGTYHFYAV